MTSEMLYELLGDIDESFAAESEIHRGPGKTIWLRWAAAAACLCLAAGAAIPMVGDASWWSDTTPAVDPNDRQETALPEQSDLRENANSVPGQMDPWEDADLIPVASVLEYNGAYYEVLRDPKALAVFGLPAGLSADMAGELLTCLELDGEGGYECVAYKTDAGLYRYASAAGDAVYMLWDGSVWYAAVFGSFISAEGDTACGLTELYRMYGVESAADIAAVTEVDWNREKALDKPVTDRRELEAFYAETERLTGYDNGAFQKQFFADVPEDAAARMHAALADDLRELRVETAEGLCFYLSFYPGFDWIYGGGTLSWYRMEEPLHTWFERNFG